jgi:hypothetical protein
MILNFEDDLGARHFEFCFVGFVMGGSMQQQKGMQVMRTEVAIFEKLESISDLKPCGKKMATGEPERQLKNGDGGSRQLSVTPSEFDLLYNYVVAVPWQSGTPVRNAVETLDWLERSDKESRK